jgi:hypothetical protein
LGLQTFCNSAREDVIGANTFNFGDEVVMGGARASQQPSKVQGCATAHNDGHRRGPSEYPVPGAPREYPEEGAGQGAGDRSQEPEKWVAHGNLHANSAAAAAHNRRNATPADQASWRSSLCSASTKNTPLVRAQKTRNQKRNPARSTFTLPSCPGRSLAYSPPGHLPLPLCSPCSFRSKNSRAISKTFPSGIHALVEKLTSRSG